MKTDLNLEGLACTTIDARKPGDFGRMLSVAIVLLSGAVFAASYLLRDFTVTEMFMAVVSLAVAAIPEELPAIMWIVAAGLGVFGLVEVEKTLLRRFRR